jgi:large subunit ribosomal protein L15
MNLEDVKANGLKYKNRKRVGRGIGSGHGKTAGRGHKGAKSRSGWSRRLGWEGGQMPLFRRLPKRGFNNKNFKKVYTIINVGELKGFADGDSVDLAAVLAAGLVSREKHSGLFKILGNGELSRKLTVRVDALTDTARQKIEAAGGQVVLIPHVAHRPKFVRKGAPAPSPVAAAAAPEPGSRGDDSTGGSD